MAFDQLRRIFIREIPFYIPPAAALFCAFALGSRWIMPRYHEIEQTEYLRQQHHREEIKQDSLAQKLSVLLSEIHLQIPENTDSPTTINEAAQQISHSAKDADMQLLRRGVSQSQLTLELQGTYGQLIDLLTSLEHLPFTYQVMRGNITAHPRHIRVRLMVDVHTGDSHG
ncbi:MAG: hypothetical protein ACQEQ4_10470 [Fibrobacterota bacterium]